MITKTELVANHTWLKIGGIADIIIPESKEELIEVLESYENKGKEYHILGNGSNVLVNDSPLDAKVIKISHCATDIQFQNTQVEVGTSVMLPQFVSRCVNEGLGGYEYLYSVPGTIGGAIFMNAGRGKSRNKTISDYLDSVEVFTEDGIKEFNKEELEFGHRYSTFHDNENWTILSAKFDLPKQDTKKGKEKIRSRMEKVENRERSKPNAGSVFKEGAKLPLHRIPPDGLTVGNAKFVTQNRICNNGGATYQDMIKLIHRAKWLNKLVPPFESPELEWMVWD